MFSNLRGPIITRFCWNAFIFEWEHTEKKSLTKIYYVNLLIYFDYPTEKRENFFLRSMFPELRAANCERIKEKEWKEMQSLGSYIFIGSTGNSFLVEFSDNSDVFALTTLTFTKQERQKCSLLPEIRYRVSGWISKFNEEWRGEKRGGLGTSRGNLLSLKNWNQGCNQLLPTTGALLIIVFIPRAQNFTSPIW